MRTNQLLIPLLLLPLTAMACGRISTETAPADSTGLIPSDQKWVGMPSGSFAMGGGTDAPRSENPPHLVYVEAFEMTRTEVTFGQYQACVDADACDPVATDLCMGLEESGDDVTPLPMRYQGADQPVVCVTWDQASDFAGWVGGRLPTEAEWEYAAKSGQTYRYAGSENPGEVAWYGGNSGTVTRSGEITGAVTHPVGKKKANAWGFFDMTGNAAEWVQDSWHDDYNGAPEDGSAWEDPSSSSRVIRGGAYRIDANGLQVTGRYRYLGMADYFGSGVGFRVAR